MFPATEKKQRWIRHVQFEYFRTYEWPQYYYMYILCWDLSLIKQPILWFTVPMKNLWPDIWENNMDNIKNTRSPSVGKVLCFWMASSSRWHRPVGEAGLLLPSWLAETAHARPLVCDWPGADWLVVGSSSNAIGLLWFAVDIVCNELCVCSLAATSTFAFWMFIPLYFVKDEMLIKSCKAVQEKWACSSPLFTISVTWLCYLDHWLL